MYSYIPTYSFFQVVPYSDHSSFPELTAFVQHLRPSCVRPIVQDFTGEKALCAVRNNMAVFDHLLDTDTPVSVEEYNNGSDNSIIMYCNHITQYLYCVLLHPHLYELLS